MEEKQAERKPLRLKDYDYSTEGAYFITICVRDRTPVLSRITVRNRNESKPSAYTSTVGDGAFDVPQIQLTHTGEIVERNLLSSEKIPGVKIDQYVIMPDHIHMIVFLLPNAGRKSENGTSRAPSPTNAMIPRVVSSFKRFCRKEIGTNLFQRSYMEHIIRDKQDDDTRCRYLYENPIRWYIRHSAPGSL